MDKFIPQSPDKFLKKEADMTVARFGHINAIVDEITALTPTVKVYSALLTQSGTSAPIATVLENTLGNTVTITYNNVGIYNVIATNLLTVGKTVVSVGAVYDFTASNASIIFVDAGTLTANGFELSTMDLTETSINGVLNKTLLRIEVYE